MGSVWVSENVTPDAATGSIGLRWRLCPFVLHFLDRDLRLLPGRRSPPSRVPLGCSSTTDTCQMFLPPTDYEIEVTFLFLLSLKDLW